MEHSELPFDFITNDKVRNVIEENWYQANLAINCNVFAGTVVLCGAVLEGLLAWAITCHEKEARGLFPEEFKYKDKTDKPITKWGLTSLIKVSNGLELKGKTSIRLIEAIQDFRNFIHPYNVIQQSARPDEGLAEISVRTVREVVRSLTGRMKNLKRS